MMFFCFVKPVMKCLCWCVPIFAGFLLLLLLFFVFTMAPQVHTRRRKVGKGRRTRVGKERGKKMNDVQYRETGREMPVPVCQFWLVYLLFFSLHFVVVCFYSGATSWYTPTLRRKAGKGRRAWKCTSQKGGRNDVLRYYETCHEMPVPVCANFCWFPFFFLFFWGGGVISLFCIGFE